MNIDPSTSQELPTDAVQRVLYITAKVHVYSVPPLTSSKGYSASTWTDQPPIFTARLRLVETAIPYPHLLSEATAISNKPLGSTGETVKTTILLEDSSSGELFAAAPYVHPSSVQQAVDSSRFFALRVVGDGGRKATLGIGFEERSDAFDFGVALQDASKVLGFAPTEAGRSSSATIMSENEKKDYSLKEGETIKIELGGRSRRKVAAPSSQPTDQSDDGKKSSNFPMLLPPPPSAKTVRKSMEVKSPLDTSSRVESSTASELGFDDGEFGEFQ